MSRLHGRTGGGDYCAVVPTPFPLPLSTLLGRVQAVFTAEFDQRLKDVGMEGMSLSLGTNVMRHLHADRGVRLGVLAEVAGVTKQAISQQVAHLEAHGYVVVESDLGDSRAKVVRLTEQGRHSQRTGRPLFRELEQQWRERFGAVRVHQLREILEQMLAQLDDTEVVPRARLGRRRGP